MPVQYENYDNDDSFRSIKGDNWYAQTFTPSISHTLVLVKLELKVWSEGENPGNIIVSIRATSGGKPTGEDLDSTFIDGSILTDSFVWYDFSGLFVALAASTMYAIVVRCDGADWLRWASDAGASAYAGGTECDSSDAGSSWDGTSSNDFSFEEWGEDVVYPDTFELALTQETPTMLIDCTVVPDTFELEVDIPPPTIICDCVITPDTFELALTQDAPGVIGETVVTPGTFFLAATLLDPRVLTYYSELPHFMEKDVIDPYSGGAWLWLCEIAVPGQSTKRIARNTENVNYGGEDYDRFNMQIGEQIFSGDGTIPRVTLRIFQDVNRVIEDIINATEGALGADVKLIRVCEKFLETSVAALEADYDNLASESDSEWVTFTLGIPNPLTQRIPLRMYSSSVCPWKTPTLFKGPECQYSGEDSSCTGTYEDCYTKGNAVHWGGELGLDSNVVRV